MLLICFPFDSGRLFSITVCYLCNNVLLEILEIVKSELISAALVDLFVR